MRLRSSAIILKLLLLLLSLASRPSFSFSLLAVESEPEVLLEVINATVASNASRSNEDSFANMIDRALEREFPENEQNEGE